MPRNGQPLKVYTVERINEETGEVISNKYGEIVGKVDGVALLDMDKLKTRLHVWRIQNKADKPQEPAQEVRYVAGFDIMSPSPSSPPGGAAATPWSPVNNCTGYPVEAQPS